MPGDSDSTYIPRSQFKLLVDGVIGEHKELATDLELSEHEADTTNVHGIIDTSKILLSGGAAGGDLTGTYPNPTIGARKVNGEKLAIEAVLTENIGAQQVTAGTIANETITVGKLGPESVGVAKLVAEAVTTGKLQNEAVTNIKIAAEAVESGKLKNEAVTNIKIAAEAVETGKIKNLNVTTGKIAEGAVTSIKIGAEAVGSTKIAAEAVSGEKLAANTVLRLAGAAVASASTITVSSATTLVEITGTTEIKKINATAKGHLIVLKINGATCTIAKGENLKLSVSFVGTELDTLTLICDGTNWFEIARSVN